MPGAMRMLFTSAGGRGHSDPLLPIARAARRAGHDVAFCCRPPMAATLEADGFAAFTAGPPIPRPAAMTPLAPTDRERELGVLRDGFAGRGIARHRATELPDIAGNWKPDVFVCDETDFGAARRSRATRHPVRDRRRERGRLVPSPGRHHRAVAGAARQERPRARPRPRDAHTILRARAGSAEVPPSRVRPRSDRAPDPSRGARRTRRAPAVAGARRRDRVLHARVGVRPRVRRPLRPRAARPRRRAVRRRRHRGHRDRPGHTRTAALAHPRGAVRRASRPAPPLPRPDLARRVGQRRRCGRVRRAASAAAAGRRPAVERRTLRRTRYRHCARRGRVLAGRRARRGRDAATRARLPRACRAICATRRSRCRAPTTRRVSRTTGGGAAADLGATPNRSGSAGSDRARWHRRGTARG